MAIFSFHVHKIQITSLVLLSHFIECVLGNLI